MTRQVPGLMIGSIATLALWLIASRINGHTPTPEPSVRQVQETVRVVDTVRTTVALSTGNAGALRVEVWRPDTRDCRVGGKNRRWYQFEDDCINAVAYRKGIELKLDPRVERIEYIPSKRKPRGVKVWWRE